MRIIVILLAILFVTASEAQSTYQAADLQKFTDLYLEAKKDKPDGSTKLQELMDIHQISPERYRSILHLSLVKELPELASNEITFINALKKEKVIATIEKEKRLKSLLTQNDFDFDQYIEMQKMYKSDLKFQQILKPYFQKSLARN